ncbi:MAG TPA: hypothetical protein VII75_04510 [Thermoanaerobaculia bacterium]|nr:hypothetical protein [Thermoanaerobaculia bacterium]
MKEGLNFLEERHAETIRQAGGDPEDWLPERQIARFRGALANWIGAQPPELRVRYADQPRQLAARMESAAQQAFSRYEQLPRFWELLQAKEQVERSYDEVRRRLQRPPKVPYFVGTMNRGTPQAVTETVVLEDDPLCREVVLFECGLFAYFSSVSQALCQLLGGTPFDLDTWFNSFNAPERDRVIARLHREHPSVLVCANALDTFVNEGWLSTPPRLELSDDFHRVHELFTYGPMIQFVFAHEFGHLSGHLHPGAEDIVIHELEHESDVIALNVLSESMLKLPMMTVAFSMWPAWVALAALRALSVKKSTDREPSNDSHPSYKRRAAHLLRALRLGAQQEPRYVKVMTEARALGKLAFHWTSAMFDLAHEIRAQR